MTTAPARWYLSACAPAEKGSLVHKADEDIRVMIHSDLVTLAPPGPGEYTYVVKFHTWIYPDQAAQKYAYGTIGTLVYPGTSLSVDVYRMKGTKSSDDIHGRLTFRSRYKYGDIWCPMETYKLQQAGSQSGGYDG